MSVITSIKQQKDKSRVNIFLDGKFGFGIDLENFVKLNLRVEQELTDEQIEKIKNKSDFQKIFNKLLNFATIRLRSEKEITDWFYRKKIPDVFHKNLFKGLGKLSLLDDEKFARLWVESRIVSQSRSKRILSHELKTKGIAKEIIKRVLDEADIDEDKIVENLLRKNAYRWDRFGKLTRQKKISEFLARRGFGWQTIRRVVK